MGNSQNPFLQRGGILDSHEFFGRRAELATAGHRRDFGQYDLKESRGKSLRPPTKELFPAAKRLFPNFWLIDHRYPQNAGNSFQLGIDFAPI